ncbi:MAG: alpha/beta fold hydrolase [Desulfobacterales bacterium]|nr:alpha/beta fold hydrolase [Desulfobacterales bacterium]
MPYVENAGVRIHYQVEGKGAPLVLQHGFGSSIEAVRTLGYPGYLEDSYQVILIDARGHGSSDKLHTPDAYGLEKSVGDILAVLDELDIKKAHFFGYSMGGVIGFAMAKYAADRLLSLILGGAHPYADDFESFHKIDGKDREAFVGALETLIGERIAPELVSLFLENDLEALAATARPRPSMETVLSNMKMPCLLFAGTDDSRHQLVKACAKHISDCRFVSFPGLGHIDCYLRVDLVIPHIRKFIEGLEIKGKTDQ